jgi:hypothetical protein
MGGVRILTRVLILSIIYSSKNPGRRSKKGYPERFCTLRKTMERLPRTAAEADKLLALSELLREAAIVVKDEWAKEDFSGPATGDTACLLPSRRLWEAQKTIESISGALVELITEPS